MITRPRRSPSGWSAIASPWRCSTPSPGDWAGGERGLAALPGREQEFRDGVDKAIRLRQGDEVPADPHDGRAVAGGA